MDLINNEFVRTLIFGVVVAVTLGVAVWIFGLALAVLGNNATRDVWKELKQRNWPVAVVLSSLVLAFAFILGFFI